ncbi:MAG: MBL fold metallo-hydrolase [Chloroflexota bacterium]
MTPQDTLKEPKVFGEGLERVAVRAITPNIFWLTHCLGDLAKDYYKEYFALLPNAEDYAGSRIVDYPFSAFLIVDEESLLIDTCGPKQKEAFLAAVQFCLEGRSLDYIWISHVELPHAGNTGALKRIWPDAQVVTVAGGENYDLHGLENAQTAAPGDIIVLGEHAVEMVDALFVDHGLSQWLFERKTGFLFTADWAHNLHEPELGHCFKFMDEMLDTGYDFHTLVEDIKVNAWYQFPWLAWCDGEDLCVAIDALFEQYDVKILAPSHGNPIRKNFEQFIPMLRDGMMRAAEMPFSNVL